MNDNKTVVFIGGLTNGMIVLEYLVKNKNVLLPLIITYPLDYNYPRTSDLGKIKKNDSDLLRDLNANKYVNKIKIINPDYIFVAGWSGLLNSELITIPKEGTIGFHPSKLPQNRGRSVLAWQIEEGYKDTALTMFYYNDVPDCGDIIAQEKIFIEDNDYLADVMNKIDNATYNLMRAYFPLIRKGINPRKPQNINDGNFRRLRTDKDSKIDWDKNANVIYNQIRAISKPYPGAYFNYENKKIRIWKSEIIDFNFIDNKFHLSSPGTIINKGVNYFIIKCRDKFIKAITDD
jgi:methionyl-tRNA formyltransferase